MQRSLSYRVLVGLLCLSFSGTLFDRVSAQVGIMSSGAGLVATGTHEIKLEPTRIRLNLPVQAEGKDSKTAIASLAEHKKKVQESLKEMKAIEKSIVFEASAVSSSIAGVGNNPNMMRAMRVNGLPLAADATDDEAEAPKIFTAQTTMVAEWELPTKDVDALALMPEMLKLQIAQKDLQGKKLKVTLNDDEQDRVNAIQRRIQQIGYSSMNVPSSVGEAQIVFVAALTDAVETEALSAAYESAAANAKVLAAASKVKLGKLRSIARSDTVDEMASAVQYEYDAYGNQVRKRPIKRGAKEVVSPTATGLSKTVNVHLSYEIE